MFESTRALVVLAACALIAGAPPSPPLTLAAEAARGGPQVGASGLDKNVVLFLVDDAVIESMRAFSRLHLYQRRIDGSFDPAGSDPEAARFYADTPTLDRLAGEGVVFTEFRAMPMCSPSRACLLTGMYPFARHGQGIITRRPYVWDDQFEFNAQPGFRYPTVVDRVRDAGRRAALVGKWHLALPAGATAVPATNGHVGTGWEHLARVGRWDDHVATFGNLNSAPVPDKNGSPASGFHGTYHHYYRNVNGAISAVTNPQTEATIAPDNRDAGYATRTQAEDAARLVEAYGDARFFLLVSFNATHSPIQPAPIGMVRTERFRIPDAAWPGKPFLNVQSKIEAVDWAVERVLSSLTPEVLDDTVVIVAGDNGVPRVALRTFDQGLMPGGGSVGRLGESYLYVLGALENALPPGASPALGPKKTGARTKQTAYERGIRSNLIVWDPSGDVVRNPGRESLAQVDVVDLMPTVLDLMGVPYDPGRLDGKSLLPVLRDTVTRETHARQFSFSEIYLPNGTGPRVNPRGEPGFRGEWSSSLGLVQPGDVVSYHSNAVYFYRALVPAAGNPALSNPDAGVWQRLAMKQRAFLMDVRGTPHPGTYKILRNYYEDAGEFVDHFYQLYDEAFVAVDPIEAYELDVQGTHAAEYRVVRASFDRFLSQPPPSLPR